MQAKLNNLSATTTATTKSETAITATAIATTTALKKNIQNDILER